MPKVLVLPDHIASQIAAGEVVERPSSVVKELVENAIDSGATQVEISISANCRDIRVADNGCGMEAEDAVLAFHRHATSKLKHVDDLWSLHSLGFRGEALPSIASVARVTCFTRTHDASEGSKLEAADGKVTSFATGCAPGTVMEVNDLFYNVPARLNFLKKATTEFGHLHETVQSLAIAFPHVAINLINQGQSVFKTTGTGGLLTAIRECGLFSGREEVCEVNAADSSIGLSVFGYIAKPIHFRGDRKGILSIVNSRPVRCPLTYKALDYAYSDLIPRGRHPLAVVAVTVDPHHLDVNIHPTKKEIKYSTGNEVYIAIQRALMSALRESKQEAAASRSRAHEIANDAAADSQIDGTHESALTNQDRGALSASVIDSAYSFSTAYNTSISGGNVSERAYSDAGVNSYLLSESNGYSESSSAFSNRESLAVSESTINEPGAGSSTNTTQLGFRDRLPYSPHSLDFTPTEHLPEQHKPRLPAGWRIAGYIHNTYIVVETPEGMEIIEQHIAHERTLYERLLSQQETAGRITDYSQRLLISAPLDLSPQQVATLELNSDLLKRLGFEFEHEGAKAICVQVPLELAHKDYAAVVQEIIQQLGIAGGAGLELEATKSIACQSSIKNGMPLSVPDLIQLLAEWLETPRNDTCPHGRPIRLKFSMNGMFQMFHPT